NAFAAALRMHSVFLPCAPRKPAQKAQIHFPDGEKGFQAIFYSGAFVISCFSPAVLIVPHDGYTVFTARNGTKTVTGSKIRIAQVSDDFTDGPFSWCRGLAPDLLRQVVQERTELGR